MKTKKTNLVIFPGNFLPNIGGLETHVDELSKYLSHKDKYNITIFTPNTAKGKTNETIHNNVKVMRYPAVELVPNFPFPKLWKKEFWKMFRGLYKQNYQIVMTRTRFFSNSTLGMIFAKFRIKKKNRKKLIHAEHGSEFVKVDSKITSAISYLYDQTFGRMLFHLSDRAISVSDISREFVKQNFLKKKEVGVIKRGLDFTKYKHINPDADILKKHKGKIVICIVTRLYKWKAVPNIIKAYKTLPKEIRDKCVFVIGGYGEDEEQIKKEAGEYLDKGIYFLGKTQFEKTAALMKASDIYVHSSDPGGALSSSLLMALYCKCAVVSSPHEGGKEALQGNEIGILLETNSPKKIREGIITLYKDKKLRDKYSQNAHAHMLEHYDWDKVIEKYEKVFEELTEGVDE